MDCPWYSPVCDEILFVFQKVYSNYENGKPYASRPYIGREDNSIKYQDKVTMFVHKIALKQVHADHLLRILSTLLPKHPVTSELKQLPIKLKTGKLSVGGFFQVDIALYRGYIKDIIGALESAKSGQYRAAQISDMITEEKEKSPFEL